MKPKLSLANFIALEGLHQAAPTYEFPKDVFDLLGKGLNTWLDGLLDALQVGPDGLILGKVHPQAIIEGRVYIAKGAIVEPTAFIQGPAYIGPGTEVRHGAYIRGNVYAGHKCVIGHTTEVKGSVFFDDAKAGHFAYIGDSLLGRHVNLGAGTKLANLKLRGDEVRYIDPHSGKKSSSGLRKFGSVLGDHVQTGCNSVLSPGSLLMPKSFVMPCAHYHGTLYPSPR